MSGGLRDQATLREFRKLLASLYPAEADQRRLAAEAGFAVGAIPFGGSAFNSWHQILHYANQNHGVDRLLSLAQEEFPGAFTDVRPAPPLEGGAFHWRGPSNGRGLLEKLISGRHALVNVAHLATGIDRARAVAKILRQDRGSGTGFLIDGHRLVTNHHVLPNAEEASTASAIFNYQKSVAGLDEPIDTFTLAPDVYFRTSTENDWTVVAVVGAPCDRWGCLELKPARVEHGDLVNIIQHPGGGPKQVSLFFDVVAYVGGNRVQYLTDTLPGSSGAPVFDRDWNLVALHHSGGWLEEPASSEKRVYYRNEGIHIDCVLAGLGQ